MATYSNDLRIKEITTGDEDGTWGTSTNLNLSLIADAFSYGTKQLAADADETFTMPDATADGVRSLYLKLTSAGALTATRTVTLGPNTVSKVWFIENATTGAQSITISQGSGTTVTVATGTTTVVYTNGAGVGAAVIDAFASLKLATGVKGVTQSAGNNSTALATTAYVDAATGAADTLAEILANGNTTGATNIIVTAGQVITADTISETTAAAGVTVDGVLLKDGGVTGSLALATGLPLSTGVTGTLPVANGGTGGSTASTARTNLLPAYAGKAGYALGVNPGETDVGFILFPGSGTVTSVELSGGTTGLTASGGPISTTGTLTLAGTLAVANGGTGATTLATKGILFGNAIGAVGVTAVGTATHVLTSNGVGVDPSFQAPAAGVSSLNTLTGDVVLKTVNSAALTGAGNIVTAVLEANTFTGVQTFKAGADIASATAVDLTAATGNTVVITGTVTSTSLTMTAGQQMVLLPSGAWPLTYNATTMNINGGVSYTAAAGDRILAVKDLAGVVRVSVTKQDGTAVIGGAIEVITPSNITPSDSATDIGETPTFTGSSYFSLYSLPQSAIQLQVNTSDTFTSPQYSSGDQTAGVSFTIPSGELVVSTQYYWRLRYKNSNGVYSDWSTATSFTTAAAFTNYIDTPASTPAAFGDAFEGVFYSGLIWN